MLKVRRSVVPVPIELRSSHISKYKEDLYSHFRLPVDERMRRRAPYNEGVILQFPQIRKSLFRVFSGKCAFCESLVETSYGEISQFRPVSNAASSHNEKGSPDHYAWLAYEWRNLLLLCSTCVRLKGSLFPVNGPRALPLTTWSEAVATEDALLLDPCVDEPRRHLGFGRGGRVFARSSRGAATINVMGLNRPELQREREDAISNLLALPREFGREAIDDFFSIDRPFAGVLRIFTFDLGRVASSASRVRLQIDFRDPANTLIQARQLLSDSDWKRSVEIVDDFLVAVDSNTLDSRAIPYIEDASRNRLREQPSLQSIRIEHFKGIDLLELNLSPRSRPASKASCAMLLGENSVGKSSLLQAVALTLMDRQSRRALKLKAEDFLKRELGTWQLTAQLAPSVVLSFEDGMKAHLSYDDEKDEFAVNCDTPCSVLAYGSRRFFVDQGARRKGTRSNKTLFDPLVTLPDPGIWLRTIDEYTFDAVARAMREVLALRKEDSIQRDDDGNVLVFAHGRLAPVSRMSDGYRSLFAMAVDIMRNMLEVWDNLEYARGVVLIDEIETHLHPRWKMQVMTALRRAMPSVQFIATTHDPLCLRGMRDGEVHVLHRDESGVVRLVEQLPNIETLRAEQILTSEYFGLWTTADIQQETVLMRLARLGGLSEREMSKAERDERDSLLQHYEGMPVIGDSQDRQILAEAMTRHLRTEPLTSPEIRAQLREDAIDQIIKVLERAMHP